MNPSLAQIVLFVCTMVQSQIEDSVICGTEATTITGAYNDAILSFNVTMIEGGSMDIDATGSAMTDSSGNDAYGLIGLEIEFPDGTLISDNDIDPGGNQDVHNGEYLVLGIGNVAAGSYTLYMFVGPGFPPPVGTTGTYKIQFQCGTLDPTISPTFYPTFQPTSIPTVMPTVDPTTSAPTTVAPTPATISPTSQPTSVPTENPTAIKYLASTTTSTGTTNTPAPTQPGSVGAGVLITGSYNNAPVIFTLVLSEECDAILDASSSTFDGISLELTDSSGLIVASGGSTVTVDNLAAGSYTVTIEGEEEVPSFAESDDDFGFICLCAVETEMSDLSGSSDSGESDSDSDSD